MTTLPSQDLALFLKQLPNKPGVYRMMNAEGNVLYVGKATDLKKRVTSYFNKHNTGPKTRSLVSQIHTIEVSITQTEIEALLLESTLIKTLKPKYNILMRDDKSYPYIHVSDHPEFPRISIYRAKKKPLSGNFFGPYPSGRAVKDTLNTIQKVFKIRNCQDSYFNARSRPCLQYQIKRCTAPCVLYISGPEYKQAVQDALLFLQGKSQLILDELSSRMEQAVKNLHYEEAAVLRDQMKHLRLVQEQQGMTQLQGDADAIAIEARPGFACVQCVTIREGQVIADNRFYPTVPEKSLDQSSEYGDLWQQTFEAFISFYYVDTPERIPALIITHQKLQDHATLEGLLTLSREKSCKIQVNPRGKKSLWMNFALNNLHLSVSEYGRKHATINSRYEELAQLLGITHQIERLECFDISHTQGEATIASCVVFDSQGPCTKAYRRFNIEGINKGDDYAAMKQVITRRFRRLMEEQSLPDVLIIDGGKGQVHSAQEALASLQVEGVVLLGIAKDPSRKAGLEKIINANESKEYILKPESKALHLLQHIRDEAHRFAITGHRNKRQKARLDSSLLHLEGIGPKRRKALLHRFGGLRDLAKAPLEEIAKVQGISEGLAKKIYEHFHGDL